MWIGVTQGFDTKLYLLLQLDKLVNLSSYKTNSTFQNHLSLTYKGNQIKWFLIYILAANDGFLLTTLKLNTFKDIQSSLHYKRGRAYENLSVRSSSCAKLSLFEITRASVLFSRKFSRQFNVLQKWNFCDCDLHHIFQSENFRFIFFLRKIV